jgi:SPP1 gp7 family putative phage head morphogenesis protein
MPTRDPTPALVRHFFALQQAGNTVFVDGVHILEQLRDAIIEEFRRIDPTEPALLRWRTYRLDRFLAEVEPRIEGAVAEWLKVTRSDLATLARREGQWAESLLVASVGQPDLVRATTVTVNRAKVILDSRPFDGLLLREHGQRMGRSTVTRLTQEVRRGMMAEESIPDIVRRIRGTQAGYIRQDPRTGQFVPPGTRGANVRPRFIGGVMGTTTREAEALVRTAVGFVSNQAHAETYQQNARLLKGEQFSATLDARTTPQCMALDGTVWPVGSAEIERPPLHWNCRSAVVPVVDWEGLGLEPPRDGPRAAREMLVDDDGTVRPGQTRRVPSAWTYEDWLRRQPAAVQDDILGPRRGRMFRGGEIASLRDLVRGDGRLVPLDQLPLAG